MFTKHWKQLQGISKPLLLTYLPAIVLLVVVFLQPRETWRILLQDPAAYFDLPFYSGLVSHLGVFLWIVSGVMAIFSSYAGRQLGRDLQRVRLLRNMGLFSLVLGIDDMFLLHELALPSVGIPEVVVLGLYGLTLAALLFFHRRVILDTVVGPLMLASLMFGLSVIFDEAAELGLPLLWRLGHSPLEDVFKILGIVGWSFYLMQTGFRTIIPEKPASPHS